MTPNYLYNLAKEEGEKEHNASECELLSEYLKYVQEDNSALIKYGHSLSCLERYNESKEIFLKAYNLINEKDKSNVELQIANQLYQCGESEKAEIWFKLAFRSKEIESKGSIWILRGWNFMRFDIIKAEECFIKAMQCQDVVLDEARIELGISLIGQRKYEEAGIEFEQALKSNPNNVHAKDFLEKIKNVDVVLKIIKEERNMDALFKLAIDEKEKKHEAAVTEVLEVYLKHKPNHGKAWQMYAESLRLVGRRESKQAYLNALMSLDNDKKSYAQMGLAQLCVDLKNTGEAEIWFEEVLKDKTYSSLGKVWFLRGTNYLVMNNFLKAEECFRRSLDLKKVKTEKVYFKLGIALRAQRKYKEAKEAFEQALRNYPDYTEVQEALVTIENIDNVLEVIDRFQKSALT